MIYIGGFAIVLATLFAWRIYASYLREQLELTRAFLRALKDYRDKMRCYLSSPAEWAAEYMPRCQQLSDLLLRVSQGESFVSAYRGTKEKYYLPDDIDESIEECFSSLGDGYLDVELGIVESAISNIADVEKRMNADIKKRERGVGALLGACAVGVVILII